MGFRPPPHQPDMKVFDIYCSKYQVQTPLCFFLSHFDILLFVNKVPCITVGMLYSLVAASRKIISAVDFTYVYYLIVLLSS